MARRRDEDPKGKAKGKGWSKADDKKAPKKKPAPVEDDEDEDDEPQPRKRPAAVEDDDAPAKPAVPKKPRAWEGAYTVLAFATFACLAAAAVFFYLDHAALAGQQVAPPTVNVPALGAPAATPQQG